jgi:N-acetylmuramic acid 6-phosphate (MurNAc-6-P) etherase
MEFVNSFLRVTEAVNPLTNDLDLSSSVEITRLLCSTDSQIFGGFGGLPCLSSDEVIAAAVAVAGHVKDALCHPNGHVVFSGCGTSGRLSHLISRGLNSWLARAYSMPPRFSYLIAGGDAALILPQEAVEDQGGAGRSDLVSWATAAALPSDAPVVVIGISCGLSAAYVASMLEAALERPRYIAVAVGFNPVDSVKKILVDGGAASFYDVLQVRRVCPRCCCALFTADLSGVRTLSAADHDLRWNTARCYTQSNCRPRSNRGIIA